MICSRSNYPWVCGSKSGQNQRGHLSSPPFRVFCLFTVDGLQLPKTAEFLKANLFYTTFKKFGEPLAGKMTLLDIGRRRYLARAAAREPWALLNP
jgi:hypothetical protein